MDLTPYIDNLRDDLATAASAGDEQTRRAATTLAAALEPAARLAMMNALADLAAEVTAHLPQHVVDVRLDGRDVRVVVTGTGERAEPDSADAAPPPPPPPPPPPSVDGGDISRITLRLFEQIKGQAEQAAAAQGVSLNTFVSQAVQGALHGKSQHDRRRKGRDTDDGGLHGWVRG
ncbi:HicB family protein [Amycolatopsis marina]|uniref:HicB family protein n=1 Tax=Amycolatopsis marina TaxID=490629 RepID=A0A1I1BYI5_9PSEU|nr:toxin-antitoxin system HicB family antitoxin [Amycolatopsis marina]SFB55505.1 HicB family protein [Amycolatopsis marina]